MGRTYRKLLLIAVVAIISAGCVPAEDPIRAMEEKRLNNDRANFFHECLINTPPGTIDAVAECRGASFSYVSK